MKDSEFLELLNLYLDHEISAADSARLEAEVKNNAERRRTYLEYCRMQKACTLLAKDFVSDSADKKVIAFEPRRSSWAGGAFAVGGLAVAAACVALVVVNRTSNAANVVAPTAPVVAAVEQPVSSAPAVVETPTPAKAAVAENLPASVIARTVTMPARRNDLKPLFVATPLVQTVANPETAALIAEAQQNALAQFEWMKTMQLAPMQAVPPEELRLEARSPLQPAGRTYMNGRGVQGDVQMSAFRFQK